MNMVANSINILDSTLGNSYELQMNRFGHELIESTCRILMKSQIDYIEYGVLASFTAGKDASVYDTTILPEFIKKNKEKNQMYSLMLDKDTRPLLGKIAKRSIDTADSIRMIFNLDELEQDIKYFLEFRKKGYAVSIVLDEVWQFDKEEFSKLLYSIRDLYPSAVFIADKSGVVSRSEFKQMTGLMEELLSPDTAIGFQGHAFGRVLEDIIEMVLNKSISHQCILSSTLNGVSIALRQMCTEQVAIKLNERVKESYGHLELNYLASKYEGYVNGCDSDEQLLLYSYLAQNRCSYSYLHFFRKMGIGVDDCIEILSSASLASQCTFDEKIAYNAMFSVHAKECSTVVFFYTKNNPEYVLRFLSDSLCDLLFHGFYVVVYDASDDNKTEAIVSSFVLSSFCNIEYKRVSKDFSKLGKEDFLSFMKEYDKYEY